MTELGAEAAIELGQALDGVPGIGHDQQRATGLERVPLPGGVGPLDAGPRFEQAHRRGAGFFAHGDEEAFSGVGIDDDPLVHEHVLLQGTFEVVAERGIGRGREHVAVVGLDQGAVTDLVVLDLGTDGHDASAGLVAGNGGLLAGYVAGDAPQLVWREERQDLALARVRGEGMQQLGVAEADAGRFDPAQDLGGAQLGHRLRGVECDLVGGHDLDRVLRLGDVDHESITWPPVTGSACPVSYCWWTR